MKSSWVKILLLTGIAAMLWAITPQNPHVRVALTRDFQGEYTTQGRPAPLADDYGFMFNAPVQTPALIPNQSSQLVVPAKYRTASMRTNILRRNANRLSANIYTPLAATGRLVIERMTAPLRCPRAVHFYVYELCRMLC